MDINIEQINNQINNAEVLEKIMDKYADKLIAFINSYIFDIYSSEDIMMDCFVEIITKKLVFENESFFKAYLYKTAKNKSLNYLKQKNKLVSLDENMLCDLMQFEDKIYAEQKQKIVYDVLKKLKIKYRQVLYLSYFENYSQSEIATILSLDERQVRNIKHRAKKKFDEILKQQNFKLDF